MVLPSLMAVLTVLMAFSIITLPAVFEVISSPSMMGTPDEIMVPRVLVNFATATFLMSDPNTGSLNIILSV